MAKTASATAELMKSRSGLFDNLLRRGHLKIRTRLTACFVAIFLLMLAANLVAVWQFHRTTASAQRLNQADQISLAGVLVHLDVDSLKNRLASLADTQSGPEFASEAASLRRKFVEDVNNAEILFSASTDIEHDPVILSTLQTLQVTLPSQVDRVIGLAALNDWPAVRLRLTDQIQGLLDLSSLLVERADREVSQQRAEAIESAQRASRQLSLVLSATALFTMLIAVLLGWYVTRTITEPLSQLNAGAQALARGEFQHEVKLTGEDELATLGKAFNYAARRLRELYRGLRDSEDALRRSEKELRDLIENVPAMVYISLPGPSNAFASRGWREYTGLSAEDTVGSGWQRVVRPEDLQPHLEKWRVCAATGEPYEDEVRFRRASDGQYRWFLERAVPLRDENGNILKWYGVLTDIEDRKRAEEERERLRHLEADLAHVNRVTTMGEITASLAHELNQPIAAAITSAHASLRWLERDPPDLARARAAILRIDRDATRAGELIKRLRAFFKKDGPQRQSVDLNEVVREMLELLRNEANRCSVSMRTELAADLPKVKADRVQLQQVFMNLMLNGMDAMKGERGELTIKSNCGQDGELLVSVSDTGVGLPPDKADQIFNAFVTTKPEGTGMGLAISRSIIESHGGHFWATNNAGPGATFHFNLPTKEVTDT